LLNSETLQYKFFGYLTIILPLCHSQLTVNDHLNEVVIELKEQNEIIEGHELLLEDLKNASNNLLFYVAIGFGMTIVFFFLTLLSLYFFFKESKTLL